MSELDRRRFLAHTAKTCFGVSLGSSMATLFSPQASAAARTAAKVAGGGKAKHIIYLFMNGGMSHIDTFDPKPAAEERIMGATSAISTNVDGIQFGHYLPELAKQADKLALIRSMNTTQGAHEQGKYFMRTGYAQRASIVHPTAGAWVNRLSEPLNDTLPPFVTVNCGNGHPGAGFLSSEYQPLPIGDPSKGLQFSKRPKHTSAAAFDKQREIQQMLDREFDERFHGGHKLVRSYGEVYNSAVKLMESKDLEAFDISKESEATKKLYGGSKFAKGCLLAKRLVEKGVRSVEVEYGGFDWHLDNFGKAEEMLPILDRALSALLIDLEANGLLDSTLVVLATEFGRTPRVSNDGGRDHYPKAFTTLMAGGGIKGGFCYGSTDETASNVTSTPVNAGDFNATIGHAMGLDFERVIQSDSKRPFRMASRKGQVISDLFA
ncbi:DUF1501 domain-containing protein [Rubritalea marina]|uniref:DUF1501 domain-containing protein n=1 Tax=Rubritalea marina TaxID=361055 RepID=UPI0003611FF7|nr:DUF1501 domain-containing protein [Rubritalea marina]